MSGKTSSAPSWWSGVRRLPRHLFVAVLWYVLGTILINFVWALARFVIYRKSFTEADLVEILDYI